ncbi:hypothetical protein GGR51DRAFT_561147 [Nemania sp. FL0031]|nr:hypothetical protein GGR51DRAFT_561147 [Nemania sp. FL0031]
MSSQAMINIVVTGNPPFMEYDFNTSQLVRDTLPYIVSRPNKKDIRILKYFRDTLDTYDDVRSVSNDIWSGKRSLFLPKPQPGDNEEVVNIDAILHLGMIALGWRHNQFRFETVARRDGYELPGDDGKHVDSDHLKSLGLPETLSTSFDINAACRIVQEHHPGVESNVSNDAGLYFCEFRLYSSLAEPFLNENLSEKRGRVLFEHLPQAHEHNDIKLARDITVTFITSIADDPVLQNEYKESEKTSSHASRPTLRSLL